MMILYTDHSKNIEIINLVSLSEKSSFYFIYLDCDWKFRRTRREVSSVWEIREKEGINHCRQHTYESTTFTSALHSTINW